MLVEEVDARPERHDAQDHEAHGIEEERQERAAHGQDARLQDRQHAPGLGDRAGHLEDGGDGPRKRPGQI